MLHLRGAPALSGSRSSELLRKIRVVVPAVTGLTAHFEHFVRLREGNENLDEAAFEVLRQLLTYGPRRFDDD